MRLSDDDCRARVAGASHGVLATRHPERGVDAVPVVFAVVQAQLVLPVDTVKAKRHGRLRRLENLAEDDRCVLLVEQYHDDWSRLWWVRVHARAAAVLGDDRDGIALGRDDHRNVWFETAVAALADRYPVYRRPGSVASVLVLTPTAWYGWEA
jgi:PPOX class probable F420-dependent enzyme